MDVNINWLAVGLATVSSMIVGSFWYAKPVFGTLWIKLAKINEKNMDKGMARLLTVVFIMAFFEAFTIAHVAVFSKDYFHNSALSAALGTAFWLWIGISATTIVVHDIFERRPVLLTALNVFHQGVTLLVMGLIIGLLGKF